MFKIVRAAFSALVVCLPMLLEKHPKTPLRVFCIAAFEYLARLRGGTLGRRRRVALAHACDFGSLRDAYYDEQKLDVAQYRSLRRVLRRLAPAAATVRYMQELKEAERGRPVLFDKAPGFVKATMDYRVAVISLSLRWLQVIAGLGIEPVRFHSLVDLVCLMQLADDLLDWKDDQARGCPSYVTAFLLVESRTDIAGPLRAQADLLLGGAVGGARQDAGAFPFALAGWATWVIAVVLIRMRFPK